mgnify:CR=1 FL=1
MRHLNELGFAQVHNENIDFYAALRADRLPPFDVVVVGGVGTIQDVDVRVDIDVGHGIGKCDCICDRVTIQHAVGLPDSDQRFGFHYPHPSGTVLSTRVRLMRRLS